MENQKNSLRVKFSIVIGCILAVLLCAAPCSALMVNSGETVNVDYGVDYLIVMGTLNLYPGAEVYSGIYAGDGSTINFYGGQMSTGYLMALGNPEITVHGTNFAVAVGEEDPCPCEPSATSFTLFPGSYPVLTGFYGNGDLINLMFYGFYIPINLVTLDSGVAIDIKPGNDQNNINLKSKGVVPVAVLTTDDFDAKSKGVVPVAVLTTDDFDAGTVNPATAQFAGASPERWKLEDVDDDGDDDLMFHFRTQELDLDQNSTEAVLTAELMVQMTIRSTAEVSGGTISGSDEVRIVSSKKSKK